MAEEKKEEVRAKEEVSEPKEAKAEAKKEAEAEEAKAEAKEAEPKEAKAEPKAAEPLKAGLSKKSREIMKSIEEMTVLELSGLVKAMEERFGVSAAVPMMAPQAGAARPGAGAGEVEEKATFSVVLAKAGDKKIQVIKEIRAMTNLGLKEAKDLVESCPKPVKEDVSKEEAEEIKKKLEAVGATIELK